MIISLSLRARSETQDSLVFRIKYAYERVISSIRVRIYRSIIIPRGRIMDCIRRTKKSDETVSLNPEMKKSHLSVVSSPFLAAHHARSLLHSGLSLYCLYFLARFPRFCARVRGGVIILCRVTNSL